MFDAKLMMKKQILAITFAVLLVTIFFSGCFEKNKKEVASAKEYDIYVDDDGTADYTSIQEAIDAANPGDIVYVYNGMYNENITITKTISLIGEDKSNTIINGSDPSYVLYVSADHVSISGFTIQSSGELIGTGVGIHTNNNSITNNIINNNAHGICVYYSDNNNTISGNIIINNRYYGMKFYCSSNNIISDNTIINNSYDGIYFEESCSNNTISGNTINNNGNGIDFWDSINNDIIGNTINNNWGGILFYYSSSNIIYHNNLINNTQNTHDTGNNTWYSTTLKEGNYWDDYTEKYPDSAQANDVWNTPYNISGGSNQDLYPLMNPVDI